MQAKIIVGSGVAARDEGVLNAALDEGWEVVGVFANGPKPWFVLANSHLWRAVPGSEPLPEDAGELTSAPPASKKKGRPKKVK